MSFILPVISFSEDTKWSGVLYVKGKGATNCGKPRISNEAWDRCEEWAKNSIKGNEKPVIKDIELYNIAIENDKGPSWNPKLNCNFRASVKCEYRMEKISTAEKLKLAKGNKLKGADESCDEPSPEEEVVQEDCEIGAESKKPVVAQVQSVVKPNAVAKTPLVVTLPKPETAVSVSKVDLASVSQDKDSAAKQPEAAPKVKLKWSGQLNVKGDGITNCSQSRITSEAWEICEAWAEKKKDKKGVTVKPEVKDINVSDITVATGKPIGNDPNPSCSFKAHVKCGYSTAIYLVEQSAQTAKEKGKVSTKESKKHNLDNLFGDGLRWSELISIDGSGISNCGKSRINNEAWERCEAWTEQQKKKHVGGLHPVLKNIELYNIASENEKGPSWDPKQSCSFRATLKCGYKME